MMLRASFFVISVIALTAITAHATNVSAADNQLTPEEEAAGWQLLFDGKTLRGWKAIEGRTTDDTFPSKRAVEEASLNPHGCGGYMLMVEKPFGDFVLKFDVRLGPLKTNPSCNTGLFFRTMPLMPKQGCDTGCNGIEVAIDSTSGTSYTDPGAIYGLSRPLLNNIYPPTIDKPGQWNRYLVTNIGNVVTVTINGELVNVVDFSQFTEPGKRPDGTDHKFGVSYKDHPRVGYLGLQDHGCDCNFKNIKIRLIGEQR